MDTSPGIHPEIKIPVSMTTLIALVLLVMIGWLNNQTDAEGRPLLLTPEVWKTVGYQKKAIGWEGDFKRLESDLNGMLSDAQVGDLLARSQSAQQILERAANLAREIDQTPAPVAVSGLQELLMETAIDYLEASRLALRWLNLPSDDAQNGAQTQLQEAHQALQQLEESQWIQTR